MKNKKDSMSPEFNEFELAWKEYFKDKPKPKTDGEDRKQQEEFQYWYNYVRKQSDTGKTPAEMYREVYGKEPGKNPDETSRIINFEWDEDYKEPQELLQEADGLNIKGKYKEALNKVNEVLEIISDDEEALLMKSELLNDLGKFDEAEKILKKIDKKDGLKAYASFYRAQRYFFEANFVRALEYMEEAYKQESDNFDFVIGLANYSYLNGEEGYTKYLEKAKNLDKKRAERFLKKFWIESKEIMEGPFPMVALENIDNLIHENKIEEAEKNIQFLIKNEKYLYKEIIKIIRGLQIECLLIRKNFEEALIKVEELNKIDKNNPHAYFYKSEWFYGNSRMDEALEEIDKCLEIAEKKLPHPDFYMLKSMILKKQDNDEYLYYKNKAKALMKGRKVLKEFMGKNK